ncbi:hypothetical protein F4818DRAFT_108688 [Hypoxylon cercidicola]|nr:hypothetical protein F4818DRAFT_108688 [Hypoxylon cercidicola]
MSIYGFVTCHETPIYPKHKSGGFNKFTCYRQCRPFDTTADLFEEKCLEEDCLEYSKLKIVCRKFYHELEHSGVFYKVNEFTFNYPDDLHLFLTSILPEKRRHIRIIRIKDYQDDERSCDCWQSKKYILDTIGTLLQDCTQLHRLKLDMEAPLAVIHRYSQINVTNSSYGFDPAILGAIKKTVQTRRGLEQLCPELFWKLPQFQLAMHFLYTREIPPDISQGDKFDIRQVKKVVIDLTDTSDIQWLRDVLEQQDYDQFRRRYGPLEHTLGNLILGTKIAVAEYRSRGDISDGIQDQNSDHSALFEYAHISLSELAEVGAG